MANLWGELIEGLKNVGQNVAKTEELRGKWGASIVEQLKSGEQYRLSPLVQNYKVVDKERFDRWKAWEGTQGDKIKEEIRAIDTQKAQDMENAMEEDMEQRQDSR